MNEGVLGWVTGYRNGARRFWVASDVFGMRGVVWDVLGLKGGAFS